MPGFARCVKPRAADLPAAALFIFVFFAGIFLHAFRASPPAMMQQIQFMKNLAIMGSMLYIVVYGSGPLSADKNP